MNPEGKPVERFLKVIPTNGHIDGKPIKILLTLLEKYSRSI